MYQKDMKLISRFCFLVNRLPLNGCFCSQGSVVNRMRIRFYRTVLCLRGSLYYFEIETTHSIMNAERECGILIFAENKNDKILSVFFVAQFKLRGFFF